MDIQYILSVLKRYYDNNIRDVKLFQEGGNNTYIAYGGKTSNAKNVSKIRIANKN